MNDKRQPPTTDEMRAMIEAAQANEPPYTEPDFAAARTFDEWMAMRHRQAEHQPTSSPGCTWKCDAYGHHDECLREAWNAGVAAGKVSA